MSTDIDSVRCVKDESSQGLVDDQQIRGRWQRYFSELLNEDFISSDRSLGFSERIDLGFHRRITIEEVKGVVCRSKNNRASDPNDIPRDV